MCRSHTPDAIKLALADPLVSKLRHDAENKHTAYQLLTSLINRITDSTKQAALRARANEQMAEWGRVQGEYQAALHEAFARYDKVSHG